MPPWYECPQAQGLSSAVEGMIDLAQYTQHLHTAAGSSLCTAAAHGPVLLPAPSHGTAVYLTGPCRKRRRLSEVVGRSQLKIPEGIHFSNHCLHPSRTLFPQGCSEGRDGTCVCSAGRIAGCSVGGEQVAAGDQQWHWGPLPTAAASDTVRIACVCKPSTRKTEIPSHYGV